MEIKVNDYDSFFPSNWKPSSAYEKVLYILDEININSWEFEQLNLKLNRMPREIFRIQHPMGYLRYTVQSEYLDFCSQHHKPGLIYMSVEDEDLEMFLNYNCDVRFIDSRARVVVPSNLPFQIKNLVVIRQRTGNSLVDTDKNKYPMYLLKF